MPADNPLAIRMKEEHDHIRELVLGLDEQADVRSLQILCDLLNHHIRFEERELFVYMENLLSTEKLNEVFKELEKHPLKTEEWKEEEFWIKKKD